MEHEEIYRLMMEALDQELDEPGRDRMTAHLQGCPTCAREWQALQAIHQLFLQAPMLSPAAGFTQRTISRLPSSSYRVWVLGGIYGLLLLLGLVPLALIVLLVSQIGPALQQPAFVRSLGQAGEQVLRLAQAILNGAWQGVGNLGELIGQHPAVLGWLLVMIGAVVLWGGIYSQLTGQRRA